MTEIQHPRLARVIKLAHKQADAYDHAFERHLAQPVRDRLMKNGQIYLHRLRTSRPATPDEIYLQEIYEKVAEPGLQALALKFHLTGDVANITRLVIACAETDSSLNILDEHREQQVLFLQNPQPTIEALEADIDTYTKKDSIGLALELIGFSHQMERANKRFSSPATPRSVLNGRG